ncbi:MAG: NAD-dependent epimerase/dehydratase family protein [Thermomicrobiales bacterium]
MTSMENLAVTTTTLVTGATGFLGPHLVWEAAARRPVVAVDRRAPDETVRAFLARDPERADRVTWVQADVTDYRSFFRAANGHAITHVIHAAAITPNAAMEAAGMRETIGVNVLGTANALDLAREYGVRRTVVFSSSSVYAANDGSPLTEDAPWRDTSAYAVSKQSIERLMAHAVYGYGMDVVAVRPAALFGPLERPTGAREAMSGVYDLMHAALAGEEIRVHDDGLTRDVTAASEVARAVVAMLHAQELPHHIYNLGAGRGYTMPEILAALKTAVPDARYRFVPSDEATISFGISVRRGPLDMTRFERDLGFALNDDLAAHLIAYRDWLRDHPY